MNLSQLCEDLLEVLNTIPGIGHAKGVLHYLLGHKEEGNQAFLAACRTTTVIIGGLVGIIGGSTGALAAGAVAGAAYDVVTAATMGFENAQGIARIIHNKTELSSWAVAGIDVGSDMFAGLGGATLINNLNKEVAKQLGEAVAMDTASKLAFKMAPQLIQDHTKAIICAMVTKGIAIGYDRRNKWAKVRRKWKAVTAFQQRGKDGKKGKVHILAKSAIQ